MVQQGEQRRQARAATERLLSNIEAEQGVLAGLLNNPKALRKIADRLQPDHFWNEGHRIAYTAMLTLHREGYRTTVDNLVEELSRVDGLSRVCNPRDNETQGWFYLVELESSLTTLDPLYEYVETVIKKSTFRQLYYAAAEIAALAQREEGDAVSQSVKLINDIALGTSRHSVTPFGEAIDAYLADLRQRKADMDEGIARGIPTGFSDLDKMIGGLQPGDLIAVGALTGYGKSSFALNIALNIALHAKHVLFFSLEMGVGEIVQRALSVYTALCHTEVKNSNLRDATLSEGELRMIEQYGQELKACCDIKLDDSAFTIEEILAKSKEVHSKKPLNLIVVDYVQLMAMTNRNKNGNQAQDLEEISQALKRLTLELQVTVMALVQLNRKVEERSSPEPMLADINASGGISRSADAVVFLYPDKEAMEQRNAGQPFPMWFKVAKARDGEMGQAPLQFSPSTVSFSEIGTPNGDAE